MISNANKIKVKCIITVTMNNIKFTCVGQIKESESESNIHIISPPVRYSFETIVHRNSEWVISVITAEKNKLLY